MSRASVLPPVHGLTRAVARSWIALRTRPLHTIIAHHRALRRTYADVSDPLSADLLSAYHRKRRLLPIKKNCLLDALALDSWLGPRGGPRQIVFGITSEPFLAHCWVQSDSAILNDSHDHVRRYSPILVI
ncbi:lasso peptide biosynthesis B2 protein [Sphingomonas canadensis]